MAHVCFIVFYDEVALGLITMANALLKHGHRATNVHFKLSSAKQVTRHKQEPKDAEFINSTGLLYGTSLDVDPWIDPEVRKLLTLLSQINPDLIGISARSNYNSEVIDLCRMIRRNSAKPLIAGGFGPTLNPEAYLDVCDWVCVGEGEECILELADCLDHGVSPEAAVNLSFKRNGAIVRNPLWAATDGPGAFRADDRIETWVIDKDRTYQSRSLRIRDCDFYTMAGRGCARKCQYCTSGQWYKVYQASEIQLRRRRNRPVGDVIQDLLPIKDKFPRIHFLDGFLMGPVEYLTELFGAYKRYIGMPFMAQIDYQQFLHHPELLELACQAGLCHTVVGIQSTSQRVRRDVFSRPETDDVFVEFTKAVDRFEVVKDLHIISHNPYESCDDIEAGYEFLARLSAKNANVDFMRLQILRGSPLETNGSSYSKHERGLEENRRIVYKQMARLFGSDRHFMEISRLVENDFPGVDVLAKQYPQVFKPHQTGFSNALLDSQRRSMAVA